MNSIGFKNFRRFANFKPIDFKDINFLVGRNNSGKSTMVKALMLIIDYLHSDDVRRFSFSSTNIENVNIVTFGRAKCRHVKNLDVISFQLQLDNVRIALLVSGQDESTIVDVQQLRIEDVKSGLYFDLQPRNSTLSLGRSAAALDALPQTVSPILAELISSESELKKTTKAITDKLSADFIHANSELKNVQQKIRSMREQIREGRIMSGNYELTTHFSPGDLKNVLTDAVDSIWADYKVQYNDVQRGKKPKKNFAQYSAFNADKFKFDQNIAEITDRFNYLTIAYLGATLNKQSALFAIRDKENMLAQSIHEYKQLGIDNDQGSDAYKFVQKWIKEDGFDIGASISINMHAGEAYEVMVKGNHVQVPLADKGMGSIQAMLLILRLATVIYKRQKFKKEFLVIIEEPELNLHPALQSKLATLFHVVATEFGIKFMVETHSEYLIRKTQLIVKEYEYEVQPNENPINIIYFDQGPVQWKMNYREDGRFINKFGTGFIDVSSNLTFDLL